MGLGAEAKGRRPGVRRPPESAEAFPVGRAVGYPVGHQRGRAGSIPAVGWGIGVCTEEEGV